MKRILFGLLVAASAAHADVVGDLRKWLAAGAEANHIAETVVIAPGYKMVIEGKPVPVFGVQLCPRVDGMRIFFFGGDPQGGSGCSIIEKSTSYVVVQFVLDGKAVTETWAVERRADQTMLRRPNGDFYLAQAN